MVDNYEIVLQKCIEQSMLNHVGWPVVHMCIYFSLHWSDKVCQWEGWRCLHQCSRITSWESSLKSSTLSLHHSCGKYGSFSTGVSYM